MSREADLFLHDILTACQKIQRYTAGLDREGLVSDEKTWDAVMRNLEVIGEAVKRLPEHITTQAPEVAWRKIAGLRDIVIHAYFGVDPGIVWDVVQNKIPPLADTVSAFLSGRSD